MPHFRIHRIKDAPGENFRWAPHSGGLTIVKQKDYEAGKEIQAPTPYAAWKLLAAEGCGLRPGDILETINTNGLQGELRIFKFVGFEPAHWYVPVLKPETESAAPNATVASESGI